MSLPTASLRPLIESIAVYYNLPDGLGYRSVEWLEGLILTESSGNPESIRYEPQPDRNKRDDGWWEDSKSYGLMQVMGFNIKNMLKIAPQYPVNFEFMKDPLAGITFGMLILKQELNTTHNDLPQALARYNGGDWGSKVNPSTGKMNCQAYIDRIVYNALKVRMDRGNHG